MSCCVAYHQGFFKYHSLTTIGLNLLEGFLEGRMLSRTCLLTHCHLKVAVFPGTLRCGENHVVFKNHTAAEAFRVMTQHRLSQRACEDDSS